MRQPLVTIIKTAVTLIQWVILTGSGCTLITVLVVDEFSAMPRAIMHSLPGMTIGPASSLVRRLSSRIFRNYCR